MEPETFWFEPDPGPPPVPVKGDRITWLDDEGVLTLVVDDVEDRGEGSWTVQVHGV